jgi:hypothetical protein
MHPLDRLSTMKEESCRTGGIGPSSGPSSKLVVIPVSHLERPPSCHLPRREEGGPAPACPLLSVPSEEAAPRLPEHPMGHGARNAELGDMASSLS